MHACIALGFVTVNPFHNNVRVLNTFTTTAVMPKDRHALKITQSATLILCLCLFGCLPGIVVPPGPCAARCLPNLLPGLDAKGPFLGLCLVQLQLVVLVLQVLQFGLLQSPLQHLVLQPRAAERHLVVVVLQLPQPLVVVVLQLSPPSLP